jgi:hypothetical protein
MRPRLSVAQMRRWQLAFHTNSVRGIGGNGRIVWRHGKEERVKGMAVGGLLVGIIVNEAREAVSASSNVDGLEEVLERFAKSLDIIVRWLAKDGGVGASQLNKEVLHVVWSTHGWMSWLIVV